MSDTVNPFHVLLSTHCGNPECDNEPVHFCKGCYSIAYCSKECQNKDWNEQHGEEHELEALDPLEVSQDVDQFEVVEGKTDKHNVVYILGLSDEARDAFLVEKRARSKGRRAGPKRVHRGRGKGRGVGVRRRRRRPKKWIHGAIKRPGAFRRKAKARGMTTSAFARTVLANPGRYSTRTVRQANLARTLRKLPRR